MIRIKHFGTVAEHDGEILFENFQFHEEGNPNTFHLIQYDNICDAVIARIRKAQQIQRRLSAIHEIERQLMDTQGVINEAKQDNII